MIGNPGELDPRRTIAAAEENLRLTGVLHERDETIRGLREENGALRGALRTADELIERNRNLRPDVKDLEKGLIQAGRKIGLLEVKAGFVDIAIRAGRQFAASLRAERKTTIMQSKAILALNEQAWSVTQEAVESGEEAEKAKRERDEMAQERNAMKGELDAALEVVDNTRNLREFYERDREQVLASAAEAQQSEEATLKRFEELGAVHNRNEELARENQELVARNVELESKIEELTKPVETVESQTLPVEDVVVLQEEEVSNVDSEELIALRAQLANLQDAEGERDSTRAENEALQRRVSALEKDNRRLETIVGGLAAQKGVKGIRLGYHLVRLLPFGSQIFRAAAQEKYGNSERK